MEAGTTKDLSKKRQSQQELFFFSKLFTGLGGFKKQNHNIKVEDSCFKIYKYLRIAYCK